MILPPYSFYCEADFAASMENQNQRHNQCDDRSSNSSQILDSTFNNQNYHNLPEITWTPDLFDWNTHDASVAASPKPDSTAYNTDSVSDKEINEQARRSSSVSGSTTSTTKKIIRPCAQCGKQFTRSYDLHRHESSHSNERKFVCQYPGCVKKYKLRQDLKAHERGAHEGRGGGGAVVLGYWQGYEDKLFGGQ